MTRQSSIDAYIANQTSGAVKRNYAHILEALRDNGPKTATEIYYAIKLKYFPGDTPLSHETCTRLTELRRMGSVREAGRKQCTITGMTVILWDLTGVVPHTLPKIETKNELIKRLQNTVKSLEQKIQTLEASKCACT